MSPKARIFALPVMALFFLVVMTVSASATTYYIAANGSDSNSGTAASSPWRHAPGMPNCSGVCSSVSISAGDSIVLRGGDTYHISASTNDSTDTAVGGVWQWTRSGASGAVIYVGTDETWFS